MTLSDKRVLITGGSGGIGRAIALRMAREGASVIVTYRGDEEGAKKTAKTMADVAPRVRQELDFLRLDVTDSQAVDGAVESVIEQLGGLDIVVNNAGVMDNQAAAMMGDEAWQSVIDTNLSGPFYVARAALTEMMFQRHGRIVNISSVAQDGASGQANYAASKAGLIGLTRSLAKEYGPRGITANAVVPGLVATEMIDDVDERLREHWETFCPAGRLATVDEVADAVWFLSRDEASFINGAVLGVSGGLDAAP